MHTCFSLPDHIHVCRVDSHIFVLDVKHDRYRALPATQTACLASLVEGWPTADDPHASEPSPKASAVAQQLVERGILALGPGKSAQPVVHQAPRAELVSDSSTARWRPSLGAALPILASLMTAQWLLRRCSFAQIIMRIEERKAAFAGQPPWFDVEQWRRIILQFRKIQPLFYAAHNACLFESLALLELLARWRVFPDWVFAVRASPFGAHCWLQYEDMALNDSAQRLRQLTPIMVI